MEPQAKQRLRFTIGIVFVVLVLVRLVVGTPDEDSTLSRAASAQMASADSAQEAEPQPTPSPTVAPPPLPPRPVVDEHIIAMQAVPDEALIDDAKGTDPSAFSAGEPASTRSTTSKGSSGPPVAVDFRAN